MEKTTAEVRGENLMGVIKAIVRDELYEREKKKESEPFLDRSGQKWDDDEEQRLKEEMGYAFGLIGHIHGRTPGAIRARVKLLYQDQLLW